MPQLLSPEEYQQLGRRYYKLGQFEKALETFNNAIGAFPTLGLHDGRAACCDKLGDDHAAVRDGKAMIRLDKQDVRGYLRTASMLVKMGQQETALGIYKYGMKNVPSNDKYFEIMQQLHDKLTRKLSPPKAIDPFTVLPVEIAEMILEYLPFRNIVSCMRVSRGWSDYLTRLPPLWKHLDMSGTCKPVPRSFVDKAVRRSQYRLSHLTLHRFEHMDVVQNLAKACKSLEDLRIITLPSQTADSLIGIVQYAAQSLTKIAVESEITMNTSTQLLRYGTQLRHVVYHQLQTYRYQADWAGPFPNLEYLRISTRGNSQMQQLALDKLLIATPALQTLILTNMSGPGPRLPFKDLPLKRLVLHQISQITNPILPPTLEELTIELSTLTNVSSIEAGLLASSLPSLTHLTLSNLSNLTQQFFTSILDLHAPTAYKTTDLTNPTPIPMHGTPLRHLSISGTLEVREKGLFRGPANTLNTSPRILTPALSSLVIRDLPLDDDEVEALLTHPTGLQVVDFSLSRITGASIRMLTDGLGGLKELKVNECANVVGYDGVQYAKARGVVVRCAMRSSVVAGARRVRY